MSLRLKKVSSPQDIQNGVFLYKMNFIPLGIRKIVNASRDSEEMRMQFLATLISH